MPPPRKSDEVEQTLLPGAPAKPATDATDTPARAGDATVAAPATPSVAPDPGATLPTEARPGAVPPAPRPVATPAPAPSAETKDGVEATLLPGTTGLAAGAPATIVGADPTTAGGEIGATLPTPGARAPAAGSVGPLGNDTGPMSASAVPGAKSGVSPSATGTMVGRFALKGLHASGGLGEVFTARDTELNREVAVKRIKSRYADDPGSRHRFLTEAELTARLDHPGVVPVFGLVNDVRGRPCYAMRFIRGETLKDEIERYHGLKKAEEQ
jgi:hypothetical protein